VGGDHGGDGDDGAAFCGVSAHAHGAVDGRGVCVPRLHARNGATNGDEHPASNHARGAPRRSARPAHDDDQRLQRGHAHLARRIGRGGGHERALLGSSGGSRLGRAHGHEVAHLNRCMTQPIPSSRILLLGAQGFIGQYVLQALLNDGHAVTGVCRAGKSLPNSEQLLWKELAVQHMTQASDWLTHLQGITLVINCVGILRQRIGERYDDVHHRMPAALAQACAQTGVRLIHTSALGLHEHAKSRFLSSKLLGEQAIAATGADHCIVRPSLIDGLGGFGASWLRMLSRWPVQIVPVGAKGKFAAVQAADLGLAYASLAQMHTFAQQRQANLGGERHFAYGEYLQLLRGVEVGEKPSLQIPLPNWMTRIGAHLCDLLRLSPFSYGHWILLQRDNLPIPNHLPALLGRAPLPVTYQHIAIKDDFRMS
jgi:uncharacterized protein YbjT (DUF2867 family)